jgi:hypothetical protein
LPSAVAERCVCRTRASGVDLGFIDGIRIIAHFGKKRQLFRNGPAVVKAFKIADIRHHKIRMKGYGCLAVFLQVRGKSRQQSLAKRALFDLERR